MTTKNNGGPAFPLAYDYIDRDGNSCTKIYQGLTTRQYIAIKAMQGELSSGLWADNLRNKYFDEEMPNLAALCYAIADAMIAEGDK